MFKKIIVPLDGSPLAEQALGPAASLAGQDGGQVVLLRAPVVKQLLIPAEAAYGILYPDQAANSSAEARAYLESAQASQAGHGFSVRTAVVDGDAAGAILDTAAQERADIIVMSSHGYSGLTRWLLGSVAEKVLRAAGCPVLVVRSQQALRRVLITLDGSELSGRVIAPAIGTALSLGANVTLLRVVPDFPVQQLRELDEFETGLGPRLVQELREDAECYMQKVMATFEGQGLQINYEVRSGPAANAILEYAEKHAIDVIAMATHGRSGLKRWVYGSVTEKVLRAGDCSMLVVRPQACSLN